MKKCILNIDLMDWPALNHRKGENKTDDLRLDDRDIDLTIIEVGLGRKALSNKEGLVMLYSSFGASFEPKEPFKPDNVH